MFKRLTSSILSRSSLYYTISLCFIILIYINFEKKSQIVQQIQLVFQNPNNSIKIEEYVRGICPSDYRVLQYIREHHFLPGSNLPYNLTPEFRPNAFTGQMVAVFKILGSIRNGFFIDSGAHDGEFISNTLIFEKEFGWKGILVEPSPIELPNLMAKHRKSPIVTACLSPRDKPLELEFQSRINYTIASRLGTLTQGQEKHWTSFKVQCFPLISILYALNVTSVDYWSLDVEGVELDVLSNFPWDSGIIIKVISVEFNLIPQGKDILIAYMTMQNYVVYQEVYHDIIFVHKSVTPLKPLEKSK